MVRSTPSISISSHSTPVELSPAQWTLVAGGLPKGTWRGEQDLPKGTWLSETDLPKGTWNEVDPLPKGTW